MAKMPNGFLYAQIKRHLKDKGEDTMEHRAVALYTHEKGPEMINEKMRGLLTKVSLDVLRKEEQLAIAACILIQHYILNKPYTNLVTTLIRRTNTILDLANMWQPHHTSYSTRDQREFGAAKMVVRTHYGRNISHLSFPHEDEILLPAGYQANVVEEYDPRVGQKVLVVHSDYMARQSDLLYEDPDWEGYQTGPE